MRLIILLSFTTSFCFCQITDVRKKQLDSIVTNIDKAILKNLDSLHEYLHFTADNDEERVFLYYGLVPIHYKYDYARKGDKKAKEYTAYYVAQKKSGVCRDFALVFEDLCKRSNIPCITASGRAKSKFWDEFKDVFKSRTKRVNHAWNVVKVNGSWRPVDPTWSYIASIEKHYTYDEDGRKKYAGKTKVSNRNYYEKSHRDFYRKRTAVHPAFYCLDTVYTYKTSQKNYKRRKVYAQNYNYSLVLDSLSSNPLYQYSKEFQHSLTAYSKLHYVRTMLYRDLNYHLLKRSKFDQLTPLDCDKHLSELEIKLTYIKKELGYNFEFENQKHKEEILKLKKKLERKQGSIAVY